MVSRIALSFSMFFLLCVAESAYKAVRLNYLISLNSSPHSKVFLGFEGSSLTLFEVLELNAIFYEKDLGYGKLILGSRLTTLKALKS